MSSGLVLISTAVNADDTVVMPDQLRPRYSVLFSTPSSASAARSRPAGSFQRPLAAARPSISAPAIRKRMVSKVSGGQSRTAILAAANAELHRKQNAAIGAQLMPGGAAAGRAAAGRVDVAFMGNPGLGAKAAGAAGEAILRGPGSIDKLFIRIDSI
ncbi:hypothetical protein D9M72_279150 [compost metagenome]